MKSPSWTEVRVLGRERLLSPLGRAFMARVFGHVSPDLCGFGVDSAPTFERSLAPPDQVRPLIGDAEPEFSHRSNLAHHYLGEVDALQSEAIEQPQARAEQHWHHLDMKFVDKAGS
jgi:hypothetical protein